MSPVFVFYNVTKPEVITCDASESGLGAALLQENKPIAYASRASLQAEMWYAQIEVILILNQARTWSLQTRSHVPTKPAVVT